MHDAVAEYYQPLVITTSPDGGFDRLSPERKRKVKILAGVEYTRRGVPRTTASGRLCLWKHRPGVDRRLDDKFENFNKYRNSQLQLECDEGDFGLLEVKIILIFLH